MAVPDSVPVNAVLSNGVKEGANEGVREGVNGHRPHTPSMSGLSLTEYSANPTPPSPQSEDHQARIRNILPEEFILPNGYPDVRNPYTTVPYLSCWLLTVALSSRFATRR